MAVLCNFTPALLPTFCAFVYKRIMMIIVIIMRKKNIIVYMLLALNDCWLQWKKNNNPKTFGLCRVSILLCLLNLNTMEKYVSGFHHDRARKEGSEWINRCIINSTGNWVKQHKEKSEKFSHEWRFTHCCKCNGLNVSPVFIVKYCVLFNVFLLKDKFLVHHVM